MHVNATRVVLESLTVEPLSVPLLEPFVIASATVTTTRAALVKVVLSGDGRRGEGLGEAAALPGVTADDQPDLLRAVARAADELVGGAIDAIDALPAHLARAIPSPVARAGVEMAILDAWGRVTGRPLCDLLAAGSSRDAKPLRTDITLPIGEAGHMADLARGYHARGFSVFKVKVGRSLEDDRATLRAVACAVPGARFRLDANEGYAPADAIALLDELVKQGLSVECFEQPCAKGDLASMARVAAAAARHGVPVVADESARLAEDVAVLRAHAAADGVNLKLAKSGGLVEAFRLGACAREAGMRVMCGAMVETRLGLTAMAHVATALGGVDFVDLDTAFLLRDDPFTGGYEDDGPDLRLTGGAGLDVGLRSAVHHKDRSS